MRKVTYGAAVSLDGFIAGPDESIGWLRMSEDVNAIMAESWKGVDAMLIGRKTHEFAARMGGGPGGMSKIKTYIFSRTLADAPEGAQLVREDAVGFVRELKAQAGGDIILMGGGELAAALIEGGVPMFPAMARRVDLTLVESRPIAQDCVLLRYAAKP
jgi:dihydrofolate reductase